MMQNSTIGAQQSIYSYVVVGWYCRVGNSFVYVYAMSTKPVLETQRLPVFFVKIKSITDRVNCHHTSKSLNKNEA